MNDPLDDLLDARLRDEAPYIDDAGFTGNVLQKLPGRPRSFAVIRGAIISLAAIFSVVLAYFASGEGLFVRHGVSSLMMLSPTVALFFAMSVGLVFTLAALWAGLSRTRESL
ncbi:MAG: hypothetical protein ABI839_06255 [Verrucomicrobiota bacterium]